MIAHNRQTMRGLYSILSGDYCKLSLTSPKIYEYLQLPSELRYPCLPEILTKAGYTTAYLQAADLAFMSKNKFMTASGFQLVLGKEFFQYQYVPFGWGPDDKAFFEQATAFVEDISKKSKPWFLTLLNVGTHHPYAVPEEWCSKFRTRKEAAVAYLDEALGDFIERLKEKGILDETLLIITCDESHGVSRQPFGNYWGLLIAQGSESSAEQQEYIQGTHHGSQDSFRLLPLQKEGNCEETHQ
jgi:arylsulfatase A-like enzyme